MKIAFNPSTVAALTTPPNNKDITFDLRGRNIFARGVKFCGTDTWRDIKINNVSIGSNILDLRNGSNTTLTNTNGVVTINSTWRPVVDNLTSDSTTSSLSANQGRVLKSLIDGKSNSGHNHDDRYVKKTGDTMFGALNFANGTWNLVGDDSYMGDCNISGHFGIKAANTTYPGISFFNNANTHLGNLTAYSGNIKYGAYSLQFLDNGNTNVSAGTWMNPFSTYNASAVADGQAICVWGQSSYLSNLAADSGDMSLWLKRVNSNVATLNMVLDGEYYANGNQRLAHVSEIPNSLKNPYSLTTFGVVYDGSAAKVVSPSNFISQVNEATSTVTDGTMFITSYASNSGFADTNAVNVPYKRKAIHLWEYIKAKTDSLYTTKSHNHDDRYVRAFGTSNDNIDSDWGQSFKTFDPIPSGTPPEQNPNISILNIGNNFNRRKQLAFIYSNDNIYYRRHVDNSFTNWRRIAFANEIPTSLKNPYALTISLNGTSQGPYDGSAAKNINITSGSIGAATSNHTHPYLPLSGGTVTGNIILKGGTSADMTYAGNVHPYIRFDNSDSSQNVSLIFTDYDTYKRPAGIKLVGNQGNEWFEAANIYATTFYGALSGNASSATKLETARNIFGLPFDGTNDIGSMSFLIDSNIDTDTSAIKWTAKIVSKYTSASTGGQGLLIGAATDRKYCRGGGIAAYATSVWGNNTNLAIYKSQGNDYNVKPVEVITITDNFNVGIGTTSPTYKLDVKGDIRATGQIIREGSSQTWVNGRRGALLRETTSTGYHTLWSLKTTNGSWDFGEYNSSGWNNIPVLSYITDTNFNRGNNTTTYQIKFPLDSGTIALTKNIPTSLPANGGNADMVDGYHANGLLTSVTNTNNGISVTVGGTTKSVSNISVNYANSAGSADTLDGVHLSGIFTAFGNNSHNITATIGGVTKEFQVNYASDADTVDGEHASSFVRAGHYASADLNKLDTYSFIRSVNSNNNSTSPKGNTGWYNIIQLVHRNGDDDGPNYMGQIALGMTTNRDDMFFRTKYENTWNSWKTVIHSGNYTQFITNYYWANVKISTSSSTTTSPTVHTLTATRVCAGHNPEIDNSISCSNWFRSSGATGWYNTTYQGGWYMSDTYWVRAHNGVGIYTSGQIYSPSSIRMSDILLEHTNEINSASGVHLNYRSSGNVSLCYGGGAVTIGTTSTDIGVNKLYVNGSEFINGASNVKDHVFANGFRHRSHNSNDSVLLAGGGYSQGVPVKYWSIESISIYGPTQVFRVNKGGNYTFVTKVEPRIKGSCVLTLQFPSGYYYENTIIWARGVLNFDISDSSNSTIYATIFQFSESKYYLNLSDDDSLNNGTCQLYFMCF